MSAASYQDVTVSEKLPVTVGTEKPRNQVSALPKSRIHHRTFLRKRYLDNLYLKINSRFKEAPKKGVAKAFSKIDPKSSSVKKEASEKPTVKKEVQKPKSNQKVNSFFGKKTESKSKKETKKIEIEEKVEDEEMEVDQKEAEDESDDEPVTKKRKSPRKKTKHRRIQMESSSDEDENEGDK